MQNLAQKFRTSIDLLYTELPVITEDDFKNSSIWNADLVVEPAGFKPYQSSKLI